MIINQQRFLRPSYHGFWQTNLEEREGGVLTKSNVGGFTCDNSVKLPLTFIHVFIQQLVPI